MTQILRNRPLALRYIATVLAPLAGLALTLAACSSSVSSAGSGSSSAAADSNRTSAASASAAACLSKVNAALKPYQGLPTGLPSSLTPLTSPPKKGGLVIKIVNGSISNDVLSGQIMAQAAKAAGWTGKYIVYNGSVQDLNAKWQQAISEHPTAIISAGVPAAAIETSLAASKKAGIITEMLGVADKPGVGNDLDAVVLGQGYYTLEGQINADLVLRNSGCQNAKVLIVSLPYPVLAYSANAFTATLKAECPSCSATVKSMQATDLGTPAGTSAVTSALQSDPGIKYVYGIVGDTTDGLASGLNAAGISGVKIFGAVPSTLSIQGLQNGTNAWWLSEASQISAWLQFDAILRVIQSGGKPLEQDAAPIGILTPQNISKTVTQPPVYPTNYVSLFEKLWGVS